jgi:hypothetical protein
MSTTRNIKATRRPEVTASAASQRIYIKSGSDTQSTRYNITADMSIYTASRLIVELRKALRLVRDENIRELNEQVANAEIPL